jgi:hypothetical protein
VTINAIYLYWTQNRYSCGLHVAAASISGIPTRRTAPRIKPSETRKNPKMGCIIPSLLQFRVFGLGFFQDGNIRIGVLPQREEALIRRAGIRRVPEH